MSKYFLIIIAIIYFLYGLFYVNESTNKARQDCTYFENYSRERIPARCIKHFME